MGERGGATFSHPPAYTTLSGYSRQALGVGTLATAFASEVGTTTLGEETLGLVRQQTGSIFPGATRPGDRQHGGGGRPMWMVHM